MEQKKQIFVIGCLIMILFIFLSSVAFPILVGQTMRHQNIILIDPGHGGSDPGKVGSGNVLEKDINLALSLKLKKALEHEKFKVYLTRDDDYNLSKDSKRSDLKNRKQRIFDLEPVAVISIHQNSYPSGDVHGAQVFYYHGFSKSKLLADSIQDALVKGLDPSNHRKSKANTDYYLLRDNPYPTVIVECGFLSNNEEKELLMKDSYQDKAAKCIVNGIKSYLNNIK